MSETDTPAVNLRKAGRDLNQIQRRLVWANEHALALELIALKTKILERMEALESHASDQPS